MNAIAEVKGQLDIVEVIGQYIQLAKAGRNFKAPCPFHSERTPSFFVSPERQSWHCFGACGEGGDVFSFVMKQEGLEFSQTLRLLAEKAGISLPERQEKTNNPETERAWQANEAAAQYFQHLLLNSTAGKTAVTYLNKRGVDTEIAQQFSLGYSPEGWNNLIPYLSERGFTAAELLRSGLVVEGDSGPYDRFRNRLMFPIWDLKGRVIGFGARALDDSLPKYINTPQTEIFDKGSTLYALDRSRDGIRGDSQAVIVEGYMDVIAAHQHGFTNVVASMGTALTEWQVRLLKRYTRKVILALDADAAGSEAALRGQEVIEGALATDSREESVPVVTWKGLVRYQESVSLELMVAELPTGNDPDDVIREDVDRWQQLINEAKPIVDYKFGVISQRGMTDPRDRAQAVQELLPLIAATTDPVIRAHYLQRLSRLSLMKEEQLARMLSRQPRKKQGTPASPPSTPTPERGDTREEFLLALLIRYPALREEGMALSGDLLWRSENREVLSAWQQSNDMESLLEQLPKDLHDNLDHLLQRRLPKLDEKTVVEAFKDCLGRLARRKIGLEKQANVAALAAQEEELGSSQLAEAASVLWKGEEQGLNDDRLALAANLQVQDLETGLRLHEEDTSKTKEDASIKASSTVKAKIVVDE